MEANRLRGNSLDMKLLLDTSFLIYCAEKGRDFLSLAEEALGEPLECYVLKDVLGELRALRAKPGKRGLMASAAAQIAEKMKLLESRSEKLSTDEKLILEAKRIGAAIATIDFDLIAEAREKGVPILTISEDQRIIFEGVRPQPPRGNP